MDDYELNDTPCPECGHSPSYGRHCQALQCEDGWVDESEDDPINFAPGEELTLCDECHGTGYEHWCPKCGHDFTLPNAHALAEERSDDSQQRVVGGSES